MVFIGHGKTHKDAASVRATHPIPAACGLYYFEVKIVSKGRDGYMGIGLSAQGVNMNRLPGWDKHSYGYHGDDGHSFCSSGTGQPYGPTFTTGDVIGCGVNLIDNTCFYTKNGHNLGVAFTDLPVSTYYLRRACHVDNLKVNILQLNLSFSQIYTQQLVCKPQGKWLMPILDKSPLCLTLRICFENLEHAPILRYKTSQYPKVKGSGRKFFTSKFFGTRIHKKEFCISIYLSIYISSKISV